MDAREFRLGNYAYGTDGTVQEITIEALQYLQKYGGTAMCQAKPIELTEEWLKRFGFISGGDKKSNNFYYKENHCLKPATNGFLYFVSPDYTYASETFLKGIESVHQLQNLYYALTHSELELTPER